MKPYLYNFTWVHGILIGLYLSPACDNTAQGWRVECGEARTPRVQVARAVPPAASVPVSKRGDEEHLAWLELAQQHSLVSQ